VLNVKNLWPPRGLPTTRPSTIAYDLSLVIRPQG
jgi:hypothetical protein